MSKQILIAIYSLFLLGVSGVLDLLGAEFFHISFLFNGIVVFYLGLRLEESEELVMALAILNGIILDCFWGRSGIGFLLYGALAGAGMYLVRSRYDWLTALSVGVLMPLLLILPYGLLQLWYRDWSELWFNWGMLIFLAALVNLLFIFPVVRILDYFSEKLHLLPEKY